MDRRDPTPEEIAAACAEIRAKRLAEKRAERSRPETPEYAPPVYQVREALGGGVVFEVV